MKKLFAELARIGRKPDPESYRWSGRVSILAWAVYHVVFLARIVSPLQWIKWAVRQWGAALKSGGRRDFHAQHTEIYFLATALLAGAACYWPELNSALASHAVARGVALWLLGESLVWVLYYLVIRSFVERSYTLFDRAEYLVLLPVVLAEQVFLTAFLTGRAPIEILLRAIGAMDADPAQFGAFLPIVGAAYLAIIVAILVNTHPGLPIRERRERRKVRERKSMEVAIIGAGDVVIERLLPALVHVGLQSSNLHVFDHRAPDSPEAARTRARLAGTAVSDAVAIDYRPVATEAGIIAEALALDCPLIVATPTPTHARYLRAFGSAPHAAPFAIEKPLLTDTGALRSGELARCMQRGYAFSYYRLEKALPLLHLLRPDVSDLAFLEWNGDERLFGPDERARRLGALQSVTICLHEADETRDWPYFLKDGGQYLETLIHPLVIWMATAPDGTRPHERLGKLGSRLEWLAIGRGPKDADSPSYFYWELRRGEVVARISCGKNLPRALIANEEPSSARPWRGARLGYVNGEIIADFNAQRADVFEQGKRAASIALRADYRATRYSVLAERFLRFVESGGTWGQSRSDGYDDQLAAISFLGTAMLDAPAPLVSWPDQLSARLQQVIRESIRLSRPAPNFDAGPANRE